jgi:hypothetical protein
MCFPLLADCRNQHTLLFRWICSYQLSAAWLPAISFAAGSSLIEISHKFASVAETGFLRLTLIRAALSVDIAVWLEVIGDLPGDQ